MKKFTRETIADPVAEAQRYVQNAKELLEGKADLDTDTQLYRDRKYVRMAGNTLWNGVLLIIDAVFGVRTHRRPHPDITDYKNEIAQRDHKLLNLVIAGYDTMHISMGYDGNPSKATCHEGIRIALDIIDRCASMLPKVA